MYVNQLKARPHPTCYNLTIQTAGLPRLYHETRSQKGKILARENFAFLPRDYHRPNKGNAKIGWFNYTLAMGFVQGK